MASLFVAPKDASELKLIQSMLRKMRVSSKVLTETEKEDLALGYLMSQADRSKKVSRETIMKKLAK
ncbi:MAG TPA: hypothetical protein VFO76_03080 [Candidatus Kapabacteria bacterium]|nr:hypothetical protein [Candidatus Kapabacteria bacterium]